MLLQLRSFDDAEYSEFWTDQHRKDQDQVSTMVDIQMVVLVVHSNFCSNYLVKCASWLTVNLHEDHLFLQSVIRNGTKKKTKNERNFSQNPTDKKKKNE